MKAEKTRSKRGCFRAARGGENKHKASCKKYKPCILKYKALILKYMPYIFRQKRHLIFNNLQKHENKPFSRFVFPLAKTENRDKAKKRVFTFPQWHYPPFSSVF